MAETNKSQLISEAELIEAINADSIISVSLGAGQPQKNVKLSTLASVVAELLSDSQCRSIVNSAINIAENLENVDLNTITKRTRAFVKSGTNLPSSGGSWWLLEVEYFRTQLYVVQRVYAYSSIGTSYQRVLRDGAWSSWVQLT